MSLLPSVSRRSPRPSHVLSAALGGLVVTTFPISVFSLALPQLEHEFGASLDAVTWVITAGPGRFTTAFLIAAIPAFLGFVAAWFIVSAPGRQEEPAEQPSALETATEQA